MYHNFRALCICSPVIVCLLTVSAPSSTAQIPASSRPRITQNIDESKLVRLAGNTRPEANAANDRGVVAGDLALEHMLLLLRRTPEQERELQTDRKSTRLNSSHGYISY